MKQPLPDDNRSEPPSYGDVVGRIAFAIREGHLSPGDVASLRRLDPKQPNAAFWRVAALHLDPVLPTAMPAREQHERSWATVLAALARCNGGHRRSSLGGALVDANVSEMRLAALLRADASSIDDQLRAVAHLAESRGATLDFGVIARLVIHPPETHAGERVRRQIARAYYSAAYRKEKSS